MYQSELEREDVPEAKAFQSNMYHFLGIRDIL